MLLTGGSTLRLWDVDRKTIIREFGDGEFRDWVKNMSVSPDGKLVAEIERGRSLRVWRTETGKKVYDGNNAALAIRCSAFTLSLKFKPLSLNWNKEDDAIYRVAFSPKGDWLACVGQGAAIRLLHLSRGREATRLKHPDVKSIAFASDGALASGGGDRVVRIWGSPTAKPVLTRQWQEAQGVKLLLFPPRGRLLVVVLEGGGVVLRDSGTGAKLHELPTYPGSVECAAFSPDGKTLATGGDDKTVCLWDVRTGRELRPSIFHRNLVSALTYSPDGATLLSGGLDGTVRMWHLGAAIKGRVLYQSASPVRALALSGDGKALAVGSDDTRIHRWGLPPRQEQRPFLGHRKGLTSVAFSPDGKWMLSGGLDHTIRFWDVSRRQVRWQVRTEGPGWAGMAGAFSPDGKLVVLGGGSPTVELRQCPSGKLITRFAVSPSITDFTAHALMLAAGQPWNVLLPLTVARTTFEDRVSSVQFSPTGQAIATGTHGGAVLLWDVPGCKELPQFTQEALPGLLSTGHVVCGSTAAFSPDGKALAVGHVGAVELWEMCSGRQIATFPCRPHGYSDSIGAVAFSPDGRTLAVGRSGDYAILLWDVTGLQARGRWGALQPTGDPLPALWRSLGSEVGQAHQALWKLVAAGPRTVSFLRDRLPVAAPVTTAQIGRLLAELDSDEFAVREKATGALEELDERAAPALRALLKSPRSLEQRRRAERLLHEAPRRAWRIVRAIAVLEQLDGAETRRLLMALSKGAPEARLTREAKVALDRLRRAGPLAWQ
jgi:WD40 repeat protein